MIHPHSELRLVNEQIGLGVFATARIPRGTMVYVEDSLEIVIPGDSSLLHDPLYGAVLQRYTHCEPDGSRALSWDIARYVNHCCVPNTLSTAYGMEIAIRDIAPGEEIRDDYGLFEFEKEIPLQCARQECRQKVRPDDIDHYAGQWDDQIQAALARFRTVPQPLLPALKPEYREILTRYLDGLEPYRSVITLKPAARH